MKVPQQYVAGLIAIARLSDSDLAEFLRAFDDPELHNAEQTADSLADRIAFSSEEIERAIETLMSLANLRADHGDSIPDFIDDLVRSMERDRRKELHLDASAQAQFKKNLTILLAVKNLIVASKAIYLRRDYEHTYCRTRILTDIRPIFEEDRTLPPVNALIVHTLQLVYHEGSGTKEIHIALDVENLSSLKVQIERAEEKTKSLKTLLAKVKLPTILD